jgi:iron(III) transport system substrate-binding protein
MVRFARAALPALLGCAFAVHAQNAQVDCAKKEGEVMVYHSTQLEDLKPVFDAFTQKYGVRVTDWRSSSENVVQRIVSEARANKHTVDLVENNSPEQEALRREKLLKKMESPHYADMRPGMLGAHHEYATSTLDVFVQPYNTDKVKKEELPKSFEDLADPKWKGRLGIEAEDYPWFGTYLRLVGRDKGLKTFAAIVDRNGVSVRKGHTLLANLVNSGEVPFALTVYNYKPPQLKAKGGHIEWIVLEPAIAQLHAVAVTSKAPHPCSAALLYDFFLGEGQPLLAKRNFYPSSSKVPSPLGDIKIHPIDPSEALDKQDEWLKLYQDTVVRRTKG